MSRSDQARASIWRQSLSVGIATGAYGVSFGAVSVAAGLSVAQTCALSLLMFSGGSQFAFAGVAASGGGPVAAITTAALVGARNGFYGLQMATVLRARGLRRLGAVQLTIDESTAVGSAQVVAHPDRPDLARLGFWATGAAVFVLWNAATLLGAVIGEVLGDPRRYGFDAAAAAAFLALLWPRLQNADARWIGAAAAVVALGAVPFAPAGIPVLAAGLVALAAAGWAARRPPSAPSPAPGQTGPGRTGPGRTGPGRTEPGRWAGPEEPASPETGPAQTVPGRTGPPHQVAPQQTPPQQPVPQQPAPQQTGLHQMGLHQTGLHQTGPERRKPEQTRPDEAGR